MSNRFYIPSSFDESSGVELLLIFVEEDVGDQFFI